MRAMMDRTHTTRRARSLASLRWLVTAALVALICAGMWGCELWGYECQSHTDCANKRICQIGYCQVQRLERPHDGAGTADDASKPFVRKACPCAIPSCDAVTQEGCATQPGCVWRRQPEIGGPMLCVIDRKALCKASSGAWDGQRCSCSQEKRFLYGGAVCLPKECSGGCQDLDGFSLLQSPVKAAARVRAIQEALVAFAATAKEPPQVLAQLKGKDVGPLMTVQHRVVESTTPLIWRIKDTYGIAPLLDQKRAVDTWLVLHGDDVTLREIMTFPSQATYPEIPAALAQTLLAKRLKIKPSALQAAPFAVEVTNTSGDQRGLQTLMLFPLWLFLHGDEELFVTSYKRTSGDPLMFRTMRFAAIR